MTPSEKLRKAEEAADWVYRLAQDDSAKTQQEFDNWLREFPLNIEEFLLAQAVSAEFKKVDRARGAALCEQSAASVVELDDNVRSIIPETSNHLVDRALTVPGAGVLGVEGRGNSPLISVVPAAVRSPDPGTVVSGGVPAGAMIHDPGTGIAVSKSPRFRGALGLAASVLLAVCASAFIANWPWGAKIYTTIHGGQQSAKLEDGSVIHLNTDSSVEVRMDKDRRLIRLLKGEALFVVAHDAARPFFVQTDDAVVRAVGTEFNVHRNNDHDTRVAVVEGVVQVSSLNERSLQQGERRSVLPAGKSGAGAEVQSGEAITPAEGGTAEPLRLAAGEEAFVNRGNVTKTAAPNVERAVAWRARRLMFSGDRLADIAKEFNRYNSRQIVVEDAAVQDKKISGIFDADDMTPLLRFVEQFSDIAVVESNDEILIRARARGTQVGEVQRRRAN